MKNTMSRCAAFLFTCLGFVVAQATTPELVLGPKPSFGLFQPRVSVEIFADPMGTQRLGPNSNSFLLDTGANGTLIFAPAIEELIVGGYVIDGEFIELGVSGIDTFDVSAPYRLDYSGTTGTEHLNDVRFLSNDGALDATGLMGLNGIVGMEAMEGRVVTIDNTTRANALTLSMGVSFADDLPQSSSHRFSVPLTPLVLPVEEQDGPIPTFGSLSTLPVTGRADGNLLTENLVLDTGAQMTIISEAMAFALGLDKNGDGSLLDDASSTVQIGGVGGTVDAPVLTVDELSVMTDQGFELKWLDADVLVRDIHPLIPGVVGADFMTGDGGLDLGSLGGGGLGGLGDLLGGGDLGDLGDLFGDLLGGGEGGLGDLLGGLLGGGDGGLGDLLGGLLGGGSGVDPFAALPLESYFDRVHFDFRGFPEAEGSVIWELRSDLSAQILNGDGLFDANDIDDLNAAIGTSDISFDLDSDGQVNSADRELLIQYVLKTLPGDTDLDQDVDFADFLVLSSEFGNANAGWSDGDFDGNRKVEFPDFLALSANFGTASAASPVPEPSSLVLLLVLSCLPVLRQRRRTAT